MLGWQQYFEQQGRYHDKFYAAIITAILNVHGSKARLSEFMFYCKEQEYTHAERLARGEAILSKLA